MSDSEKKPDADAERPTIEFIPPPVVKVNYHGQRLRCYDVDEGHWNIINAIIIDYQSLHLWATKIELRYHLALQDISLLVDQNALIQGSLDEAKKGMELNYQMYTKERDGRLKLQSSSKLATYLLGGVAIVGWVVAAGTTTYAVLK